MTSPVPPSSLSWPTGAAVLPVSQVRPVLERLESLARTNPRDLTWIPGLAQEDGEISADPPPALEQIVDEFGGIAVHGRRDLDLLIDERGDIGPYTMLGEATSYYPLYEGSDVAVVLTLDEDGTPGAVYGIGEDLALRLAALDLPSYLQRYADALEAAVSGIDARLRELYDEDALEDEELRADVGEQLLDAQLYAAILGMGEQDDAAAVPLRPLGGDAVADPLPAGGPAADGSGAADGHPGSASENAPAGAVAVVDLRGAAPGAMVDVMDADLPGDPLGQQVEWRDGGLLVYVVAE
ncbi:hypothetical protein [Brachybacterium sp. p3-SID957]|uniref:hypothetical protein n=1 Tax=Brachybacterium sp. p3-SID957 TaxID=2916049 RepID=UPI00223ADFD4|nr:hypothetical protein [Brachybacterium sp. p3-SID957]MCT1776329.1 hypothetical protein [Brachybacterium sp. p3-SID957]